MFYFEENGLRRKKVDQLLRIQQFKKQNLETASFF